MDNKQRVVDAVNLLIASTNYSKLINEITGILENWATHPMTYAGHLSPLNALIDVGVQDRAAFERLVKLIESKRRLAPATKRVDYQRIYMAEKRARLAKAIELRELLKGKLDPAAKKAYASEIQSTWSTARTAFIKAKGELSWEERNAAAEEFWQGIDARLDEALAAERAKRKP